MNRVAGIVVAVIGLIIAVLGIIKILPGLTSTGVSLLCLGGLIFGLSFVSKPDPQDTPRMSTGSTLANIFVAPGEVFRNLRRHPRWLVAALIMSLMGAVYTNAFIYRLTAERVANYAIDKTLEMSMLNDEARKQIESGRANAIEQNKNPLIRTGQAVNSFVGLVFWMSFLALIFFLFALAMGGQMNYWQAFSVAVYASLPPALLRYGLSLIILFIKDPSDIHPLMGQSSLVQDNLGFLTTGGAHPVLFVLLTSLGLIWIYWIILNQMGINLAGERTTSTIGWAASLTVYIVGVALGMILALLFPSFFS